MERLTKVSKGKTVKYLSQIVIDRQARQLVADGWAIDEKPYKATLTPKGKLYELDTDAWEDELAQRERCDKANESVEPIAVVEEPVAKKKQRSRAVADESEGQ